MVGLKKYMNDFISKNKVVSFEVIQLEKKRYEKELNNYYKARKLKLINDLINHRSEKEYKVVEHPLNYKDESYFTEEEMITGYKAPKYSELSEIEKELWQEKENQNQEL